CVGHGDPPGLLEGSPCFRSKTKLHEQWKQRLERASYETALARRRYEAVDPQNRLVARTLERDWEAALWSCFGKMESPLIAQEDLHAPHTLYERVSG
ncbi:MAG: hypothetical protein ACJ8DD_07150, partial [Microvirga sp.]